MLRHSLAWEKEQKDPTKKLDYLTFALVRTGVCVMLQNDKFEYEYVANVPQQWSITDNVPPSDQAMFGEALGKRLEAEKANLLETGESCEFEWTTRSGSTFHFSIELVFDRENGREIFTAVKDLTKERQRENVLRTLLKEVSHRSKNLLAMVQSVTFQTARHSDSLDRFVDRFRGRLQAISNSQDAITQNDWQGSSAMALVERQKSLFSQSVQQLIQFEGQDTNLTPNATMHLGLALHELISNAKNHGNFLVENKAISICFEQHAHDDRANEVTFVWHEEANDEKNAQDAEKHFGSVVLERIVPAAVSGNAETENGINGFTYKLTFPVNA